MDNFNSIKEIWLSAKVAELSETDKIVRIVKRHRLIFFIKKMGVVFMAVALLGVMIWVIVDYDSALISTRIGEVCMLTALLVLLGANMRSLWKMPLSKDITNKQYINFLRDEQLRQISFKKTIQRICWGLSCIGLCLYIFEMVSKNIVEIIASYALVTAWILFCWFVIRPISIKFNSRKMLNIIEQLERLSIQLND